MVLLHNWSKPVQQRHHYILTECLIFKQKAPGLYQEKVISPWCALTVRVKIAFLKFQMVLNQ